MWEHEYIRKTKRGEVRDNSLSSASLLFYAMNEKKGEMRSCGSFKDTLSHGLTNLDLHVEEEEQASKSGAECSFL